MISIRASMSSITFTVFEPKSLSTMPTTFSPSPLARAVPLLIAGRISTVARLERSTGTPSLLVTTVFLRSSSVCTSPMLRTMYSSCPRTMKLAPTFWLFPLIRSMRSETVRSYFRRAFGSTSIWNCLTSPPMLRTCETSGTDFSSYFTSQSWSVLSSMVV